MVLCSHIYKIFSNMMQPSLSRCHQLPSATKSGTLRWLLLDVEPYLQILTHSLDLTAEMVAQLE